MVLKAKYNKPYRFQSPNALKNSNYKIDVL